MMLPGACLVQANPELALARMNPFNTTPAAGSVAPL
ncbi:MAG: hypothetical protein JWR60_2886 [Polaromonas sp.]|nr:hypothetical protein [Polaromonas sp.]